MRRVCQRLSQVAVFVGVLGTLPLLQEAGANTSQAQSDVVGTVISTTGGGYAVGPEGRRSLECGTPIRRGEHVVTPSGARVGLVSSDVYVQLDSNTDVAVDRGTSGAPQFTFVSGHARVVDTREAGDLLLIRAPGSMASGLGTDTEVVVAAGSTEYCEDSAELGVTADDDVLTTGPGQCVTLRPGASPTTSTKTSSELPLAGASDCVNVAIVDHFTPGVAAPAATISLAPIDPPRTLNEPCDGPGGCGRSLPPMQITIVEQPPETIEGPGRR